MYDGLRFIVCDDTFCTQLTHRLSGLSTTYVDNVIKSEHGWLGDFDVTIRGGRRGKHATFRGSLHKYFHGQNTEIFTLSDVCQAVEQLCFESGLVNERTQITRLEFGLNIPCRSPKSIIDSALLFRGKTGSRFPQMKIENIIYDRLYKEWRFTEYTVKLYGKGPNILRYEFHYDYLRLGIKELCHLLDPQKMVKCIDVLLNGLDQFTFVPCDREGNLPSDLSLHWEGYRAESFWEDLSRKSRSKKSRTVALINRAIIEYNLIDWRKFLRRKILEQVPDILGVAWTDATKSTLGLLFDSVAGRNEACNRQTEKDIQSDGTFYIYTKSIHSVSGRNPQPQPQQRHVGVSCNCVTGCHNARAPPHHRLLNEDFMDDYYIFVVAVQNRGEKVHKLIYKSKSIYSKQKPFYV